MNFQDLNLIKPILQAIDDAGYAVPTPIQQQAIPYILNSQDVLGYAQTGTGKTAAFAMPMLQLLSAGAGSRERQPIKALILTPTRELALQIDESFDAYGKYLNVKHAAIFGGVSQVPQVAAIKSGLTVLIATPGRLQDLMQQKLLDISHIEIFVLDEADRMLDMGFINDVKRIVAKLPAKRQTLFFSATMPNEIKSLANSMLRSPKEVKVTPVSSTVDRINQSVCFVEKGDKANLLVHLLGDKSITRSLVFTRTKHGADKLVKQLTRTGIYAAAIHGNKSQNARQKALADFRDSKIRVLVATDIAARGIDIDDLPYVVNYELPEVPETYVHRIGRTGRAGADGTAVSFCDPEERADLKSIQKLIGFEVPVMKTPALSSIKAIPEINTQKNVIEPAVRREKKQPESRRASAPKVQEPKTIHTRSAVTELITHQEEKRPVITTRTVEEKNPGREVVDNFWLDEAPLIKEAPLAKETFVAREVSVTKEAPRTKEIPVVVPLAPGQVKSGEVVFFSAAKGYGFITDDTNGEKIFVHSNQLLERVKQKDKVTFEMAKDAKGFCAVNVRKV